MTIRLLDESMYKVSLTDLGMSERDLKILRKTLARPHGQLLISGPTGSGKSTTLYSALDELNRPSVKIYTVEDPVERKMPGILQTQVKPSIGLNFASALRSLVRSDPDIIMIGEIRDLETAVIATEAALTGHLVLSTLHTNDAPTTPNSPVRDGRGTLPHCFLPGLRGCPEARAASVSTMPQDVKADLSKHESGRA